MQNLWICFDCIKFFKRVCIYKLVNAIFWKYSKGYYFLGTIAAFPWQPTPYEVFPSSQYVLIELNLFPSPQIFAQMTSSGALLSSPGIPVGLLGNPFTVFQVGYWKIQLVLTENRVWAIESGWTWSGGTTTSKDTWTEIWGDGVDTLSKTMLL